MVYRQTFLILAIVGSALAYSNSSAVLDLDNFLRNIPLFTGGPKNGQFVPKSYYVIDHNGHKSDVIYFRSKRAASDLLSLLRRRRSQSSAGASSSAGSGSGNFDFAFPPEIQRLVDPGFYPGYLNNLAQNNFGAGPSPQGRSFSSSSSSGGAPTQNGGFIDKKGLGDTAGYDGPVLFSRFGEGVGSGIEVSGAAQGPNGAFSSSSSSIDGDGKVKYSVQSGKY